MKRPPPRVILSQQPCSSVVQKSSHHLGESDEVSREHAFLSTLQKVAEFEMNIRNIWRT